MRLVVLTLCAAVLLWGGSKKLTDEERIELIRGLSAEYATAKIVLPRSKKPLEFKSTGEWDKAAWNEANREFGPAARVGDMVQVTKVDIDDKKIVFELDGGLKLKKKWYERIEIGMGTRTTPVARNDGPRATGTSIALVFPDHVPAVPASEIKKLLKPILDFEQRSATELYIETLPAPIQEAIKQKKVVEGMDREQVILAVGRPRDKIRESRDGLDYEDWIYGQPPGKITFVTFKGQTVVKVKDTYANLGGSTAPPLPPVQ